MAALSTPIGTVKTVGSNGQISLGKQFAGRQVLVEEYESGVWHIRTATVIPDNERWLHDNPQTLRDLETALAWSLANPPDDSNVDAILDEMSK